MMHVANVGEARSALFCWVGTPNSHQTLYIEHVNPIGKPKYFERLADRKVGEIGQIRPDEGTKMRLCTSIPASARGCLRRS